MRLQNKNRHFLRGTHRRLSLNYLVSWMILATNSNWNFIGWNSNVPKRKKTRTDWKWMHRWWKKKKRNSRIFYIFSSFFFLSLSLLFSPSKITIRSVRNSCFLLLFLRRFVFNCVLQYKYNQGSVLRNTFQLEYDHGE